MKKASLTGLLLIAIAWSGFAQVPVTNGLKLHLDAASGFSDNGTSPATWQDLSSNGNDLTSGLSFPNNNNAAAEPTYCADASGSGFPGIYFDGINDYMSKLAPTTGFNSTSATLFIVRIGCTVDNMIGSSWATTLSIGESNSYQNEFALMGDWALHCTASGRWVRKDHPCYSSLPNNKPAVLCASLNTGITNSDIGYYVNGSSSVNTSVTVNTSGSPLNYTSVNRSIIVGARFDGALNSGVQASTYFEGYILEVLAYNRLLNSTEINSVNNYLTAKYGPLTLSCVPVPSCNINPMTLCSTPPSPGSSCNDSCYWKVTGNTILGGNNYFGTNSNDGIKIRTNAIDRGFIATGNSTTGGYLGWNTMTPTARLHVNCANGNTGSGLSDVRFENLEYGAGRILVINNQGYVTNSDIDIPTGGFSNFWNVNGNIIGGGPNYLGTNSGDDVILRTNNINRGKLTSGTSGAPGDDGRLGWQTLNPTAHLHINCGGGNPDDGSQGSDVRFEKLEPGKGYILVIDEQGYVYKSNRRIEEYQGKSTDTKIEELENEIEELKTKINAMSSQNTSATNAVGVNNQSKLFQNSPNPFSKETKIEYYVHELNKAAYITINDLNGRILYRYPIDKKGNGSIIVHAENMVPGLYLYTLIIDGVEIDTKRMVIDK